MYHQPATAYPDKWMKVDYVTGADLFVSRKVLDECGAFHPAFFMYYEESEGEGGKDGCSSRFLRDNIRQQKSEYIYYKLTEPRIKYYIYRIIHPILRQTVWFNPNISMGDKWKLVKQLFVSIKL